jgi:hypothetical protein
MPAPRNDEVHAFFLCQLSWSRVRISPERCGVTRRANGAAKRTQGRQVSYSVFSVRHTLHRSHVAGLVEENGRMQQPEHLPRANDGRAARPARPG